MSPMRLLALAAALLLAAASAGEPDHGVRITAPMDGWAQPQDRPIALSYFAIWPPCTAPRPCTASTTDTCPSPPGADGVQWVAETQVVVNSHHILTQELREDNQYAHSVVLPAGSLPLGANEVVVILRCKGGPREQPPVRADSVIFNTVDIAAWERLGDDGARKAAEPSKNHGGSAQPTRFLSQFPRLHVPAASARPQTSASDGTQARAGREGVGLRCAVMVYHSNVRSAYPRRWIDKSVRSILAQTHENFDIYELNYGAEGGDVALSVLAPFLHLLQGRHYTFLSRKLDSHAAAMNMLLDRIFKDGYDVAFNVNIDDYYAPTRCGPFLQMNSMLYTCRKNVHPPSICLCLSVRWSTCLSGCMPTRTVTRTHMHTHTHTHRFERQLEAIARGAHLVSSEFVRVTADASDTSDEVHVDYSPTYLTTNELFGFHARAEGDAADVSAQLAWDHNVLCHPGVAFTRHFWHALSALRCAQPVLEAAQEEEARTHAHLHTAHSPLAVCGGAVAGAVRSGVRVGDFEGSLLRPLRYRDAELPAEDLRLWQRAVLMGDIWAVVVPQVLVFYRIHDRQISPSSGGMDQAWHRKMARSGDFQTRLRIGILTVCTGRYCQHLERHLVSVLSNFLPDHGRFCYIFTDQVAAAREIVARLGGAENSGVSQDFSAMVVPIAGRGFPADTLYRYHYFLLQESHVQTTTDAVFYLDVDLLVTERIRAFEVMPSRQHPLVAVRHMLQDGRGTPETRAQSRAQIPAHALRRCYFAGGFVGGRTPEFVAMAGSIAQAIDTDDAREVVAVWHDESHLNRYLADHAWAVRVLSPAYLYPEGYPIPYQPRISVQEIPHAPTRYARERFVAPCGAGEGGVCALGPGLGASLFNVAAAVALASALNQDEGGTLVRDGLGQALQALQVLLPLTWCFRGSDQLCTDGGKEEVEEVRREGRVSYRESWLASFRRSDKFGDLRVTQVSCSRFKHRCASMISPRY